eukprot:TRINITY_DN3748_c0_g1_i1.p2 TRINITY_DN3748_c0_g1~~TRINITY_DN3748_c0_g1_i1.p2  ORF type:complete len:270 (+),score=71.89 TRINITY_DN3748_c0_g1_i1:40-810(+)
MADPSLEQELSQIQTAEELESFMAYYEFDESDKAQVRSEWQSKQPPPGDCQDRGLGTALLVGAGAIAGYTILNKIAKKNKNKTGGKPPWNKFTQSNFMPAAAGFGAGALTGGVATHFMGQHHQQGQHKGIDPAFGAQPAYGAQPGYGAPPPTGAPYGAPPPTGAPYGAPPAPYGAPPQSGGYPPQSAPYGAPPASGGYPPQPAYGAPPASNPYPGVSNPYPGVAPQSGGYPPASGGYPPQQPAYGAPPPTGGYPGY